MGALPGRAVWTNDCHEKIPIADIVSPGCFHHRWYPSITQMTEPSKLMPAPVQLTIVSPTYNEIANVRELLERLRCALDGLAWEIIFVDDNSPDQTAGEVRRLAQEDSRVRCLQRIGRRGLASACIEGMLASSAPYIAVMDADLQHDEALLPQMLQQLETGTCDLVIGSRYVDGGRTGTMAARRAQMSRLATRLSRLVTPPELQDPMSGFFMVTREAFEACLPRLSGIGFKILLDLFASSPSPLRFEELPYQFRTRHAGASKLDDRALWDYGMLLLDKLVGRYVPVRFVAFALVGGTGVVAHMVLLGILYVGFSNSFLSSQVWATLGAMTLNFGINNLITYGDRRLQGWDWLRGWLSFSLICSIGIVANVGVASSLHGRDTFWALAGLAGILIGATWNYSVTRIYTWKTD